MRVGIISPYSLSIPGGVQGQILGLARCLRRDGHVVRVLGPCDGAPPEPGVTPIGNSLPTSVNGSVAPIAPDVPAQLRTIRVLRDEDFDVVHLHEPLVPGPTQTALMVKTAPLIGTFHAAGSLSPYRWFGAAVRRMARRLDLRCAVSEEARDAAQRTLGGTYELVFNAVDTTDYDRAEPWPTNGHPTVLFLGRHEPRKGLDVLLASVAHLPGDVRLWVAGDGPDTDALKARYTSDRIAWLGRIDEDEKRSRLRGADVFCAPSLRGESFGIVLLEAMAAGTPVVASALPGYAKVARDGADAALVPPGDPEALAAALTEVLTDPARHAGLVAAGHTRVADFSMTRLARMYAGFYERIATPAAAR